MQTQAHDLFPPIKPQAVSLKQNLAYTHGLFEEKQTMNLGSRHNKPDWLVSSHIWHSQKW